MDRENKVKQLALRVDRELIRKITEIDEYLSGQSLYIRRSLSATIRFCVENQWLSMGSIFAEQRAQRAIEQTPTAVEKVQPEPKPAKPRKPKGKMSDNGKVKPTRPKRNRALKSIER